VKQCWTKKREDKKTNKAESADIALTTNSVDDLACVQLIVISKLVMEKL
jgi:hypothetical protein